MCQSRFHRVRSWIEKGKVLVEDMEGRLSSVSLLALEPEEPVPGPGDWLVVHSGYAIDRLDAREGEMVRAELRGEGARVHMLEHDS